MTELRKLYLYDSVTGNEIGIDNSTASIQVIQYEHHEIHSASHYFNEFYVDIPASDVLDIRFTTPDTTKWLHMLIALLSQEEIRVTLFENAPIITAGTGLTAYNNNRNSANASAISGFDYIVNTSVANADADTDVSGATTLRNYQMGSNQGNIEGHLRDSNELVLKQNTSYCLRIENLVASVRYVSWQLSWYEHTDKA